MKTKLLIILLLALYFPLNSLAEVYKWVDNQGNISFSQFPPSDRPSNSVQIEWSSSDALSQAAPEELDYLNEETLVMPDEEAIVESSDFKTVDNKKIEAVCSNAKNRLKELRDPRSRIMKKDKNGEYKVANAKDKAKMVLKEEKILKQFCQ